MIFQKKEIKDDTNKFLIVDSEIDINNSKDETKKHDISFDSDKSVKNKKEIFKNHIGYTSRIILNSIIPIITLILSILFINLALNSNVKEISTIIENSNATYSVCLNDNGFYDSKCIGEDQEYLSLITKYINAELSYTSVYSEKSNRTFSYNIKSNINIIRNDETKKTLYKKEFTLLKDKKYKSDKNVVSIYENINIPYAEYNKMVNDYLTEFSVDSIANLDVSLYIDDKKVSTLNIPLSTQSFNISKDIIKNKTTTETKKHNIRSLTIIYILLSIVSIIIFVISTLRLILQLIKYNTKKDSYSYELNKILKEYDKVIVEMKDCDVNTKGKTIYKVGSFLELIDARDTIEKPILFVRINNIKSIFYVIDNDIVYKYTMKDNNL